MLWDKAFRGRPAVLSATVSLVLAGLAMGCSSGTGTPRGKDPGSSAGSGVPDPAPKGSAAVSATPDYTLDPDRAPRSAAAALRLARRVVAGPDDYGADFVRQRPFESDPRSWAVLDRSCAYQRETLPKTVLTSLAQHLTRPARTAGGEPLRATSVVTVHRTTASADQEMATMLEEALRCPDQRIEPGERVSDLYSSGSPYGRRGQESSDDQLFEQGTYETDARPGHYPYIWATARIGPVTVSVTLKGGKGFSDKEVSDIVNVPLVTMQQAVKGELS